MSDDFSHLVSESIQLELNVAELYLLFHNSFPEDGAFWWELAVEEKNHAALIKSGFEDFYPMSLFPRDLLARKLKDVRMANSRLESLLATYKAASPSREEALNVALGIEQSAGEIHFQKFMEKQAESDIDKVFQDLARDDRDHSERIQAYMRRQGLEPAPIFS
jgi:ferritin